jgi:hypothetical protein
VVVVNHRVKLLKKFPGYFRGILLGVKPHVQALFPIVSPAAY